MVNSIWIFFLGEKGSLMDTDAWSFRESQDSPTGMVLFWVHVHGRTASIFSLTLWIKAPSWGHEGKVALLASVFPRRDHYAKAQALGLVLSTNVTATNTSNTFSVISVFLRQDFQGFPMRSLLSLHRVRAALMSYLPWKFPLFSQNPKKWQPSTTCWAYLQHLRKTYLMSCKTRWILACWVVRFLGCFSWDIFLVHVLSLLSLLTQTCPERLHFHPSQDQSDNWEGQRRRTFYSFTEKSISYILWPDRKSDLDLDTGSWDCKKDKISKVHTCVYRDAPYVIAKKCSSVISKC